MLDGESPFGVEGLDHSCLVPLRSEDNFDFPPGPKGEGDLFMLSHNIVGAAEIEPHAAILRLHADHNVSAGSKVILRRRRMPVVRSETPLRDVLRLVPIPPHFLDRSPYDRLYGDSCRIA